MLAVRHRFREKQIRVLALRAPHALEGLILLLEDFSTGQLEPLDAVESVVATGGVADDHLYRELRGRVADLRMAGDCVAPRTALEAIYNGHAAGRALQREGIGRRRLGPRRETSRVSALRPSPLARVDAGQTRREGDDSREGSVGGERRDRQP